MFYVPAVEICQRCGEICFLRPYRGSLFPNLLESRNADSFPLLSQQPEIDIGVKKKGISFKKIYDIFMV
jgi:hypothetical protein